MIGCHVHHQPSQPRQGMLPSQMVCDQGRLYPAGTVLRGVLCAVQFERHEVGCCCCLPQHCDLVAEPR